MHGMNDPGFSYNRRAVAATGIFHGLLLLLFLEMPVRFSSEEPPKFYELNLGTVSQQRMEQILGEASRQEAASRLRRAETSPRERVEVPNRRMVELEEPTVSIPEPQRVESDDIVQKAERPDIALESTRPALSRSTREQLFSMERKQTFEGSKITVGDTPETGTPGTGKETETIGEEMARSFQIEGDIKGRELLHNPLPEYPAGLNRNATIRISFAVLPDGSVSPVEMVPVRKENAVLEELTMSMLKRWRFAPLPAGDTRTQRGIVTFFYKIQ